MTSEAIPGAQLRRGREGRGRTVRMNLNENVFCCFDSRCGKQGDVIDLWAAVRQLSLREAGLDLVRTFELEAAPARATEKRHGVKTGTVDMPSHGPTCRLRRGRSGCVRSLPPQT